MEVDPDLSPSFYFFIVCLHVSQVSSGETDSRTEANLRITVFALQKPL